VLAFWFGEPDRPTPPFIVEAAKAALDAGDTFYLPDLGLPALRESLAAYVGRLHGGGASVGAARIGVTRSGVDALMLAAQALVSPGDRVVAVVPLWPNLTAIASALGARVDTVPLSVAGDRWRLDVERLRAALTPDTRLLMINSPGNPTGWVMPADAIRAVRGHLRRQGIWILSDEACESWLRWCVARPAATLQDGADRLAGFLARRRARPRDARRFSAARPRAAPRSRAGRRSRCACRRCGRAPSAR
jgi:aspartate/methionine/tyrosine aminotransferase